MATDKLFPFSSDLFSLLFCTMVFLGFVCSTEQVEILSESTMRRIFDNNSHLVIYVCEQQNSQVYEHFSDYCFEHPCAYLGKNNQFYENIRNFVGYSAKNYLLILDSPRKLKYVFEINDAASYKDIYNFEADFTSHKLQPYFSSEQQQTQVYEPCRKLVGNNFDQFLNLKAPIKVVYLYTQQPSCNICGQMLRGFADIAQKIYRKDVIAFGYFDIFKNDHPLIPSEIAPYFLVFKEGQDEPYGIEGEKFPELQNALVNIIAEHIYPNYKKQQHEKRNDRIQIQDLIQVQPLDIDERKQPVATNVEL